MSDHETGHVHGTPTVVEAGASSTAFHLMFTLAFFGALGGAILAYTYQKTLPAIEKFAGEKVEGAVREVLRSPARLDTLYLVGDKLSKTPPAGVGIGDATKLFIGYDAAGARIGVAVNEGTPGFADEVRMMVGFDPATGTLTGFKILSQKETPGLGDKIEKDTAFAPRFQDKVTPLKGTKSVTTDRSTVQTITGATISSKAVIKVLNKAVATWQPRLAAYTKEGGQ